MSLDLLGRISTVPEFRAFTESTTVEKRDLLVTALLTSPEFVLRMTEVFDLMWIERRPDKHVAAGPCRDFVHPSDWLVSTAGGSGGGFLLFWKPDDEKQSASFKLPNIARDMDISPTFV